MKTLLVSLRENFMVALRALIQNKMRSVLTTLGIIIGVLTVVSVASIISGSDFRPGKLDPVCEQISLGFR